MSDVAPGRSAADLALEELGAFQDRQHDNGDAEIDPDAPPAMKASPSGSDESGTSPLLASREHRQCHLIHQALLGSRSHLAARMALLEQGCVHASVAEASGCLVTTSAPKIAALRVIMPRAKSASLHTAGSHLSRSLRPGLGTHEPWP